MLNVKHVCARDIRAGDVLVSRVRDESWTVAGAVTFGGRNARPSTVIRTEDGQFSTLAPTDLVRVQA